MPQFCHMGKLMRYDRDNGKILDSALISILRTLTDSAPPLPGDLGQEKETFRLPTAESSLEAEPRAR